MHNSGHGSPSSLPQQRGFAGFCLRVAGKQPWGSFSIPFLQNSFPKYRTDTRLPKGQSELQEVCSEKNISWVLRYSQLCGKATADLLVRRGLHVGESLEQLSTRH